MFSKRIHVFCFLVLIAFCSCLTAGTHGSIKAFQYSVSKYTLEKAVETVISTNKNIQRDTAKAYDDSTKYGYYNDGSNYMTVRITENQTTNKYIFKYSGNKEYWDTSKVSSLFIAYAYDKDGNGGSEGSGGLSWYKFGLRKKLVSLFETEFISKVDKELRVNHTEPD